MALLEFPQDPLHVSCPKYRSHSEVDQAGIPGIRGALRAKPASEGVSSRRVYAPACRGFGSVSRRAVNGETEGLAGPQGRGRQQRRREHEGGTPLAGTRRHEKPRRTLSPCGGLPRCRNKHSDRQKVQKILQRKFPQHFLGQTAFPNSFFYRGAFWAALLPHPGRMSSRWSAGLRCYPCRFASRVRPTHFGASVHVDGGGAPPVRLDEQPLTVTQRHVHGLKGRGGTRMIQDLRNRRFHGGTQRHGSPPRRWLQTIRRSSRRPARSVGPPIARLR